MPNVGKSSVINSLKRSHACQIGSMPGLTRFASQNNNNIVIISTCVVFYLSYFNQKQYHSIVYDHQQHIRYLIFKSLMNSQYFIGPADMYGGDYSLYKGKSTDDNYLIFF